MDYQKLNIETWRSLDESGDLITGYKSRWLALKDDEKSKLHIFKDNSGKYHFAIEASNLNKKDLDDPRVNGLQMQLTPYKFDSGSVNKFIDLTCSISGYLEEFTEVVKEISKSILEEKEKPINAVNQVINKWISFWANKRKEILSEEDQIGLICELIILSKLCQINPGKALGTWTGPLGEIHDFNFLDWNFEVKGTRKSERTHTINGIDQLKPAHNKHLGFISFQLTSTINENSLNLPCLIENLIKDYFKNKPDLTVRFNELLSGAGYSPIHAEEYRKFNVEVMDSTFFEVDEDFPKLTSEMLNEPIKNRVSSIRYDISLSGLEGEELDNLNWGSYFY